MFLYTYNEASEGAKALANALKIKRIRHEGSKFVGHKDKVVINWGASIVTYEVLKCKVINHPEKTILASNKLIFFRTLSRVTEDAPRLVPHTEVAATALAWAQEGKTVCSRLILSGSSGEGLHITEDQNEIPYAKLYTQYVPKKDEYRVHFVNGAIIDYQRKALRPDVPKENVNWKVRNLDNGFIFVRGDVVLPDDVRVQAERTIKHLDLDFGAIDIIYNEKSAMAYVLEVNTAPGVVGTTLENYAKAFEAYRPNNDKSE